MIRKSSQQLPDNETIATSAGIVKPPASEYTI